MLILGLKEGVDGAPALDSRPLNATFAPPGRSSAGFFSIGTGSM
jgi:hypothetical protein